MPSTISQSTLKEWMHYNPKTGICTRLKGYHNKCHAGDILGKLCRNYLYVGIAGRRYRLHRLIWFYMTGSFPKHEVDHWNGIKTDNRWKNLRNATTETNKQNYKMPVTNRSGFLGVHFDKDANRYRAKIRCKSVFGNSPKHLGFFDTAEEAGRAYLEAKKKVHSFQPVPRANYKS